MYFPVEILITELTLSSWGSLGRWLLSDSENFSGVRTPGPRRVGDNGGGGATFQSATVDFGGGAAPTRGHGSKCVCVWACAFSVIHMHLGQKTG